MTDKPPSRQLTEEEWVILLDVYLTYKEESMSASHPAILRASETLRALAGRGGRMVDPGFRPSSGIYRQLQVFRRLDSSRASGKVPQLAETVWKRLSGDPKGCQMLAEVVRAKVHAAESGG
jgi:hypothetical protein